MAYISAQNIVKTYDGHQALKGLSAEIHQGQITGLLGPNGAGKTTFIRILNHIILPDSGELLFRKKPFTNKSIQAIGYLPEERGLYKKMKVREHLKYLAKLKGRENKEIEESITQWLKKLALLEWKNTTIERLSKGMQQKVQFIATVLHDPDFIILDEPFTGFDPVNAEAIRKEILELKAKGKTILLSTHRMESVEELCDHIILIHKAENVLSGRLKELKEQFKEGVYEFKGIGKLPELNYTIKELNEQTEGYLLKLKLKEEELTKVIALLNTHTQLKGVREVLPTMNDVFFKVVGRNE